MPDDKTEPKKSLVNFGKLTNKPTPVPKLPKFNNKGFGLPAVVRRSGRGR